MAVKNLRFLSKLSHPGRPLLAIFNFHRVLASSDHFYGDASNRELFRRQLQEINSLFEIVSLENLVDAWITGRNGGPLASITFDDGYADNLSVALPILKEFNATATIFVATDFIGEGIMLLDLVREGFRRTSRTDVDLEAFGLGNLSLRSIPERLEAVGKVVAKFKYAPRDKRHFLTEALLSGLGLSRSQFDRLVMTEAQLMQIQDAGLSLGSHTHEHTILTSMPLEQAFADIQKGKGTLEKITGNKVRFFAYPNGFYNRDFTDDHVRLVQKAGFEFAFSSDRGF